MRRLVSIFSAAALTATLFGLGAASATVVTAGAWYYGDPGQTYTDSTSVVTSGISYKSAVRAPISADGTSNFAAKRGVVPVQFDLLAAPTTVTTTTRNYDPPVWESIAGEGNRNYTYAYLRLSSTLTFSDISNLSADYLFTTGDCFGGSLRWDISVMHGGVNRIVNVYYGNPNGSPNPPGQSCSGAQSESGENLISSSTAPADRFEMQGGWGIGPKYTTYADALASTNNGTDVVTQVQLTLDSGWMAPQVADVSNVTVNDNTWVPKTVETLSSSTVVGDYAKTCDLPQAELRFAKNDSSASGGVNEAESIQPSDTGQYYRQVDCKYIYNLDVSSLSGSGTYTVWVRIDGSNIPEPATFDLK